MKLRTKIILIVVGIFVVLCAAGGWFVASNIRETTLGMQDSARAEGDFILQTLGKTWGMEDLRDVASADFLASVPDEADKQAWLDKMKKELGAYASGTGVAQALKPVKGIANDDALGVVYINEATFARRKARVRIQLIYRPIGGWQMAAMDIDPQQ